MKFIVDKSVGACAQPCAQLWITGVFPQITEHISGIPPDLSMGLRPVAGAPA